MTTQVEFTLATRATAETLSDNMRAFAKLHAAVRVQASDAEAPYITWLKDNVFPYLPTVTDTCRVNGESVEYIAGFDKKDARYKAVRDTYKDGIAPFWISRAESVLHDGVEITPAMAMTDDTRAIPKGDYKTALMALRETIKNNIDQEWSRLMPEFERPDSDKKTDTEIVEAFITMYTKRQKSAAKNGKDHVHESDIMAARDLLLAYLPAAIHAQADTVGAKILDDAGVSVAA